MPIDGTRSLGATQTVNRPSAKPARQQRMLSLDAMRGLAALIVIVFHASLFFEVVPKAYLAVDFFFLLSGVVIARAYTPRFENGLTLARFMKERVIRVYPLLLLGLGIGYAEALVQFALQSPTKPSIMFLSVGTFFNMLMLPSPVSTYSLFPFNIPAWSLFLELLANFAFALFMVKLSNRVMVPLLALLGACMVYIALQPAAFNVGDAWSNLAPGLVRTLFSFGLGVQMERALRNRTVVASWWSLVPMLALCALLIAPIDAAEGIYDIALVFVAFPLIVWAGAHFNPPAVMKPIAQVLGDTSYAVYAVHYPLLFIAAGVASWLGVPVLVWLPLFMAAMLVASVYLVRYYDAPARRWMARKLIKPAALSGHGLTATA